MHCFVLSNRFVSSGNFSVDISLNDLQSTVSTFLQLIVDVASAPSNYQPGDRVDSQNITTIAVAAGIAVSFVCRLVMRFPTSAPRSHLIFNPSQALCVAIGCCYFIARRRSNMKRHASESLLQQSLLVDHRASTTHLDFIQTPAETAVVPPILKPSAPPAECGALVVAVTRHAVRPSIHSPASPALLQPPQALNIDEISEDMTDQ
jgi:hypothetical protein